MLIIITGTPECAYTQRALSLCLYYRHRAWLLVPHEAMTAWTRCCQYGHYSLPLVTLWDPSRGVESLIGGGDSLCEYLEELDEMEGQEE